MRNTHIGLAAGFAATLLLGGCVFQSTYNNMLAQLKGGKPIPEVISWAQNELEGFVR